MRNLFLAAVAMVLAGPAAARLFVASSTDDADLSMDVAAALATLPAISVLVAAPRHRRDAVRESFA